MRRQVGSLSRGRALEEDGQDANQEECPCCPDWEEEIAPDWGAKHLESTVSFGVLEHLDHPGWVSWRSLSSVIQPGDPARDPRLGSVLLD